VHVREKQTGIDTDTLLTIPVSRYLTNFKLQTVTLPR